MVWIIWTQLCKIKGGDITKIGVCANKVAQSQVFIHRKGMRDRFVESTQTGTIVDFKPAPGGESGHRTFLE